ncbi:MAG: cell division protein FtsL [Candidatus Aminicenantes bacterium]|nr:cell division protein FtsL [Candidatus Aminicenantes bacterium]
MIRKKITKKEILIGIVSILVIITLLTFYIWHQAETIRLGYKTQELEEDISNLKKEIEQLEAEKASLLSLERVERIARKKLKMKPPEEQQILQDSTMADLRNR